MSKVPDNLALTAYEYIINLINSAEEYGKCKINFILNGYVKNINKENIEVCLDKGITGFKCKFEGNEIEICKYHEKDIMNDTGGYTKNLFELHIIRKSLNEEIYNFCIMDSRQFISIVGYMTIDFDSSIPTLIFNEISCNNYIK